MSNPLTSLILMALTAVSLAACGLAVARIHRGRVLGRPGAAGTQNLLLGVILAGTLGLFAYRWLGDGGRWQPLGSHLDGLILISALLTGTLLYVQNRARLFGLSAFGLPVLALLLGWAVCASAWTYRPFALDTLHPVWQAMHLGGVYLGTLGCALAAVAGGMFLYVQRRLKRKDDLGSLGRLASLEALEAVLIHAATLGFGLLTLGLVAGLVIISEDRTGLTGGFFPLKVALAVTAWLVYAVLMNLRWATGFRGARAAWLSITGLTLLLATYAAVTALPTASHPSGAPGAGQPRAVVSPLDGGGG